MFFVRCLFYYYKSDIAKMFFLELAGQMKHGKMMRMTSRLHLEEIVLSSSLKDEPTEEDTHHGVDSDDSDCDYVPPLRVVYVSQ